MGACCQAFKDQRQQRVIQDLKCGLFELLSYDGRRLSGSVGLIRQAALMFKSGFKHVTDFSFNVRHQNVSMCKQMLL